MSVSPVDVNVPDSIVAFETLLPSCKKSFCLAARSSLRQGNFQ